MHGAQRSPLALIHAAFKEHPSDMLTLMSTMAQTFAELDAMFEYLRLDLDAAEVPRRAQDLVQAGSRLAANAALELGCRAEAYRESLAEAGVLPAS